MSIDNNRLQQLEQDLRQGNVYQAKVALDELAQCPSEVAVPLLQRAVQTSDVLRRRFAVMGLGNHRTPEAFAALTALADNEQDPNILGEVANSLYDFGEPAMPLLETLFERNPQWLVRQSILGILMDSDRDELLFKLAKIALQDEEQTVIEAGIFALGKILTGRYHDEALTLLSPLASDEDWRIRWRTATVLRLSPSAPAKVLLHQLQQDENHYVAAQALEASLPEGGI